MQMLETIQEYVPFKHHFVYFSSWIGSRYGATKPAESIPTQHVTDEDDAGRKSLIETDAENDTEGNSNIELKENSLVEDVISRDDLRSHPLEASEVETKFIDSVPGSEESLLEENGVTNSKQTCLMKKDSRRKAGVNYGSMLRTDVVNSGNENHLNSRSSQERKSRVDSFLYNNIPVEECSCCSDSENDQRRRSAHRKKSKDRNRESHSFKLPLFLKRRKRTKRRGNTFNSHKSYTGKVRCDCAIGGEDLCLIHMKSHSESDINTSMYKVGDDYLADLSDISVKSFSIVDDESSNDSYVDINLYNVRKSLVDSGSYSQSDRSLELSSDWSEIHHTASDPSLADEGLSVAEECRESDIPDTASDFSQDSRTTATLPQRKRLRRRFKKIPLLGHNVNESFIENECFCCHCIVM
eukprot:Seg7394.2 transcript_id=Seg7394.2/GoldUCD/mRNA.D3Y31 product="hypothetical protein" protein_id=Seg7394.2/GoldUCD/D3Y31